MSELELLQTISGLLLEIKFILRVLLICGCAICGGVFWLVVRASLRDLF